MNLIINLKNNLLFVKGLVCLVFILFSMSTVMTGQAKLQGVVRSVDTQDPIVSAQVIAYSLDGEQIFAATITDGDGAYSLTLKVDLAIKLVVNGLFYAPEEVQIQLSALIVEQNINLSEKLFSLQVIEIEAKRPMVIKEDTVVYDAAFYARGDEVVAEDLLRNIPGVSVSGDGKVSVKGQEVEKIMLDNDDFFEKGYRKVTKTLRAALIEEVEVLDNYNNLSLLKGFENSGKVAINLKLKESAKLTTFGDFTAAVDVASFGNYLGQLNLINLKGKQKIYSLLSANNLGERPLDDLENLWKPITATDNSLVSYDEEVRRLAEVMGESPDFRVNRTIDNQVGVASVSSIINIGSKFKVRPVVSGYLEGQQFANSQTEKYLLGQGRQIVNERFSNMDQSDQYLLAKIDVFANIDAAQQFTARTSVRTGENRIQNDFSLNSEESLEVVKYRDYSLAQRLTYLRKISDNTAWLSTLYGTMIRRPQDYFLSFNPFRSGIGTSWGSDSIRQNTRMNQARLNLESHLFLKDQKTKKKKYEILIGGYWQRDELRINGVDNPSDYFPNGGLVDGNSIKFFNRRGYVKAIRSGGKGKLGYTASTNINYFSTTRDYNDSLSSKGRVIISPAITIKYRLAPKELFALNATREVRNLTVQDVFPTRYLRSNSRWEEGQNGLDQLLSAKVAFTHQHGKFSDRFSSFSSLVFRFDEDYISGQTTVYDNFTLRKLLRLPGRQTWQGLSSINHFFPAIRNNLKVFLQATRMTFADQLLVSEEVSDRQITSRQETFGIEVRSTFKGSFNYHCGVTLAQSRFIGVVGSLNSEQRFFTDLSFRPTKRLQASFVLESMLLATEGEASASLWLMDGSFSYELDSKKVCLTLLVRNFLDQNTFDSRSTSALSRSQSVLYLLPRSVRIGAKFLL